MNTQWREVNGGRYGMSPDPLNPFSGYGPKAYTNNYDPFDHGIGEVSLGLEATGDISHEIAKTAHSMNDSVFGEEKHAPHELHRRSPQHTSHPLKKKPQESPKSSWHKSQHAGRSTSLFGYQSKTGPGKATMSPTQQARDELSYKQASDRGSRSALKSKLNSHRATVGSMPTDLHEGLLDGFVNHLKTIYRGTKQLAEHATSPWEDVGHVVLGDIYKGLGTMVGLASTFSLMNVSSGYSGSTLAPYLMKMGAAEIMSGPSSPSDIGFRLALAGESDLLGSFATVALPAFKGLKLFDAVGVLGADGWVGAESSAQAAIHNSMSCVVVCYCNDSSIGLFRIEPLVWIEASAGLNIRSETYH